MGLLPERENLNPLWQVAPRRQPLDPVITANAIVENKRVPGGFATTLAEDWIAAGAPDAVVNGDTLNYEAIITYLISAVQHCHEGLARRVVREAQLQAEIDQLRAVIDVLIVDLVGEKGRIDKLPKYGSGIGGLL